MDEATGQSAQLRLVGAKSRAGRSARGTPRSISVLLLMLVAITILPTLAFSVLLLRYNTQAQEEVVDTLAVAATNSIAETIEREIGGMLTTLRVLSTSPAVREGREEDFYNWAKGALRESNTFLIMLDPDSNQIFNTRVPFGAPLGKTSDQQSVLQALDTGRPVVSDVFYGNTAEQWVFNVLIPMAQIDGQRRILVLTQNAENLAQTLVESRSNNGRSVALLDRHGKVVTSSSSETLTGSPFPLSLDPSLRKGNASGEVEYQGNRYEITTSVSAISGWLVVSWRSAADAQAPMRRSLFYLVLGGMAVIAVAVMAASLLARQIARPVRHLAIDARRLGAGQPVEAKPYNVEEAAVVSRALAAASRDRQEAESEIRFLMREVAHRSKNQLTVVSSIAKQSARSARSFADFQESFQTRIQGLARSTDLLIAGGAAGVELRDLICAQLEPFRPDSQSRLEIEGPEFRLSNQSAQTLGMAFHELATNAAKYGAFSGAEGRIKVSWELAGADLALVWREHLRLLRKRPERRGFGTEVIERMVGLALDARIERVMHGDGLEWLFVIPTSRLANVLEERGQEA